MSLEGDVVEEVGDRGWAVLDTPSLQDFERLAHGLGSPRPSRLRGPAFETLGVTSLAEARPHSHSARFGEGAIPFHTDAAHWSLPARFLMLRSAGSSSRSTHVVEIASSIADKGADWLLAAGVFTVVDGPRSFLASAWDPVRKLLRYDASCMKPATRAALIAGATLERMAAEAKVMTISWSPGRTLVLDNWRCVHARAPAGVGAEGPRLLARALLEARG